jgi:molecular chaperone Hsp33
MKDHLVRVVSKDGLLRGVVADTAQLVKEITAAQQTDLTATVALGRLLTGGAILGCLLKGNQRLALMIEGNGPLRKLSVEADANGRVRGTIAQPVAGLPPKDERFDVAGAIGKAGFLHVWKDMGLKTPYQSMVQLQSSEVAEDIAWYLTTSEQVPSCLGLGVELDAAGLVAAAGGFMVQALPPGDAGQVESMIERIKGLPPVTTLLRNGMTPLAIAEKLFGEVGFVVQEQTPLSFFCPCQKAQIEAMLVSLGRDELQSLADEQDVVGVTCEYCRTVYHFDQSELKTILDSIS